VIFEYGSAAVAAVKLGPRTVQTADGHSTFAGSVEDWTCEHRNNFQQLRESAVRKVRVYATRCAMDADLDQMLAEMLRAPDELGEWADSEFAARRILGWVSERYGGTGWRLAPLFTRCEVWRVRDGYVCRLTLSKTGRVPVPELHCRYINQPRCAVRVCTGARGDRTRAKNCSYTTATSSLS
jgi:hypothetical protein